MNKADDKLERARQLLDGDELSLGELAQAVGLSASHLQRRFSARYGLSPAEYLAQHKLGSLKSQLREGSDVTTALYDAGYGSPSRVYEVGAACLGMSPARYRAGGEGERIRWSLVATALGGFAWQVAAGLVADELVAGPKPVFGHGVQVRLTSGAVLLGCYHPSQQNMFTGRLTPAMLDDVFTTAAELAGNETGPRRR